MFTVFTIFTGTAVFGTGAGGVLMSISVYRKRKEKGGDGCQEQKKGECLFHTGIVDS